VIFKPKRVRPLAAVAIAATVISFWVLAECHAQAPVASAVADREMRWQQDLRRFGHEFASHHVDLRFNPGGDSSVINPLTGGLKARAALRSKLYVLIGPGTASSAQDAAIQLRRDLHATLVGEPTREAPNG
jgi:hypothetical protein